MMMSQDAEHYQSRWKSLTASAGPILRPVLGILLLLLINASFDFTRAGTSGLFGSGSFLNISWRDGAPVGNLIDILNNGAPVMILAMGMTLVIATGGIDLSVGSIMAVSASVMAVLVVHGTPSWLAIAAGIGAGIACGLWNGLLVTILGLQPFVATLVLMVAGRGIAQLITGGQSPTFHDSLLSYIGIGRPAFLPLPVPFIIALVIAIATVMITRRTALGLLLESVGSNSEAARLAGVRSKTIITATYVFSGFCSGVAGVIVASLISSADPFHAGLTLELAAIFAVVVGGTSLMGGRFSLTGAFAGALLLQTLTTSMYARGMRDDVAPLPKALVIVAVCLVGAPVFRNQIRSLMHRFRRERGRAAS